MKISRAYISFPLGMRTLHHSCGVLMRACSQYFKSFHNRPAISFREVSQCPLCSIVVHSKGSLSHLQQLHTGRVLFSNENNSRGKAARRSTGNPLLRDVNSTFIYQQRTVYYTTMDVRISLNTPLTEFLPRWLLEVRYPTT